MTSCSDYDGRLPEPPYQTPDDIEEARTEHYAELVQLQERLATSEAGAARLRATLQRAFTGVGLVPLSEVNAALSSDSGATFLAAVREGEAALSMHPCMCGGDFRCTRCKGLDALRSIVGGAS